MKLSKINFIAVLCFSMLLNFCSKAKPKTDLELFYNAVHDSILTSIATMESPHFKGVSEFNKYVKTLKEAKEKLEKIKNPSTKQDYEKIESIYQSTFQIIDALKLYYQINAYKNFNDEERISYLSALFSGEISPRHGGGSNSGGGASGGGASGGGDVKYDGGGAGVGPAKRSAGNYPYGRFDGDDDDDRGWVESF